MCSIAGRQPWQAGATGTPLSICNAGQVVGMYLETGLLSKLRKVYSPLYMLIVIARGSCLLRCARSCTRTRTHTHTLAHAWNLSEREARKMKMELEERIAAQVL